MCNFILSLAKLKAIKRDETVPAAGDVNAFLPSGLLLLFAADRRAVLQLTLAQLFGEEERRERRHAPHHVVGDGPLRRFGQQLAQAVKVRWYAHHDHLVFVDLQRFRQQHVDVLDPLHVRVLLLHFAQLERVV